MEGQCPSCATHLASLWKFCPQCGAIVPPESHPPAPHVEPEKAPTKGAYSGLLFGAIVAPMAIIVGTLLCLTGLGAIVGVPLIILGIVSPLLGPLIGLGALEKKPAVRSHT
jgi:hypothetical protein